MCLWWWVGVACYNLNIISSFHSVQSFVALITQELFADWKWCGLASCDFFGGLATTSDTPAGE